MEPSKSNIMFVSRSRKVPRGEITFSDIKFPIKENVKYLGLFIDHKLKWTRHINETINKCERSLNLMRSIMKVTWGTDFNTAMTIYKCLVRSHLDYGCIIYSNTTKNNLRRLDIIHNKALRMCVGAMMSTPIAALQIEAQDPPLFLRRRYLAVKYILRIITKNRTTILKKVSILATEDLVNKYWQKKESPLLASAFRFTAKYQARIYSPPTATISFSQFYKTDIIHFPKYTGHPNQDRMLFASIRDNLRETLTIYTDGSKNKNGCGCAIFAQSSCHSVARKYQLDPAASIFTAEAVAILEALKYGSLTTVKHLVIMSDSGSVLRAIQLKKHPSNMHPVVIEIVGELSRLREKSVMTELFWIKSHCGIGPNETVDSLAKESVNSGEPYEPILSETDLLHLTKQVILKQEWDVYWKSIWTTKMTQYARIHPTTSTNSWYNDHKLSRHYRSTIARLKFGHGTYQGHLYKINLIDSPTCTCGEEEASLDHLFLACNSHKADIEELQKFLIRKAIPLPTNIITLLNLNSREIDDHIINMAIRAKYHI